MVHPVIVREGGVDAGGSWAKRNGRNSIRRPHGIGCIFRRARLSACVCETRSPFTEVEKEEEKISSPREPSQKTMKEVVDFSSGLYRAYFQICRCWNSLRFITNHQCADSLALTLNKTSRTCNSTVRSIVTQCKRVRLSIGSWLTRLIISKICNIPHRTDTVHFDRSSWKYDTKIIGIWDTKQAATVSA